LNPPAIPPMLFAASNSPPAANDQTLLQSVKSQPSLRKRRRTTSQELAILEDEYTKNPRPGKLDRERICKTLNWESKTLQIWFQNRRQSQRKKHTPNLPPRSVFTNLAFSNITLRLSTSIGGKAEVTIDSTPGKRKRIDGKENIPLMALLEEDEEAAVQSLIGLKAAAW